MVVSVGAALLLGACASTPGAPAPDSTSSAEARPPSEGLRFGPIEDNALPKGACGMVLWTLEDQTPQPIFRFVAGEAGEAVLNREPRVFTLARTDGASRYGVSERQTFVSEDGLELAVAISFGLGFDGGHYLERGLLTVEDDAGWRTVAPVAGLAGCRGA